MSKSIFKRLLLVSLPNRNIMDNLSHTLLNTHLTIGPQSTSSFLKNSILRNRRTNLLASFLDQIGQNIGTIVCVQTNNFGCFKNTIWKADEYRALAFAISNVQKQVWYTNFPSYGVKHRIQIRNQAPWYWLSHNRRETDGFVQERHTSQFHM